MSKRKTFIRVFASKPNLKKEIIKNICYCVWIYHRYKLPKQTPEAYSDAELRGIDGIFHFSLIFSIFDLSETSTLFVKEIIITILWIRHHQGFKFLIYVMSITSAYFMLLDNYETLPEQYRSLSRFTKDFFMRVLFSKVCKGIIVVRLK